MKERLFHGMQQHLRDSVQFCYKQTGTTYATLLAEALEEEREKITENKSTSVKVRSVVTEVGESSGIQDLRQKIDALSMVVKSSTFNGTAKPKKSNGETPNNNFSKKDKNGNGTPTNSLYKNKGPGALAVGSLKAGQKHIQCYQCGGWGHTV